MRFFSRYYVRGGRPTGSHMVGFSRAALRAFAAKLAAMHRRDRSHLIGFDTWLQRLEADAMIRRPPAPLAYQRKHALVKRR